MTGNTEISVFLPTDCYEQVEDLCSRYNWTHGALLLRLMIDPPPISRRTEPLVKTKRADSPHRFTANIDAYYRKEFDYICGNRSWTRRDGIIHLLEHYLSKQRQKEIHNG